MSEARLPAVIGGRVSYEGQSRHESNPSHTGLRFVVDIR